MSDWRGRCEELARLVERDVDEIVEWWVERAAIREHDGGQPRDVAERDAFDELRAELELALVSGPRLGPRRAEDEPSADTATAKR